MPPKSSPPEQPGLFRSALVNLVDRRHPLMRLAGMVDCDRFATAFGPLYREGVSRPGLPTRLIVGLHLIKHMDGLSDEAVCARFLDCPYVQLFCGESHFQNALPLDRSSMTRSRKRIGPERLDLLLAETLAAAQRAGAAEPKHFERVTVDTTVQPKALTQPTDSKLLHRGVAILLRLAKEHGIKPRQSYTRVSTRARREIAKLIHRGRHREAERKVSRMRSWFGRLGSAGLRATSAARSPAPPRPCAPPSPRRSSASHACCAGAVKTAAARRSMRCTPRRWRASSGPMGVSKERPWEPAQGQSAHPLRIRREGLACHHQSPALGGQCVLGARALPGNPFDGHTLAAQIAQTERITGLPLQRAYLDRGYRGQDADRARVFLSGQKRGVTPTIRREIRRRAGIDPVIGPMT